MLCDIVETVTIRRIRASFHVPGVAPSVLQRRLADLSVDYAAAFAVSAARTPVAVRIGGTGFARHAGETREHSGSAAAIRRPLEPVVS
jgi:hypothetical protein